MITHMCVSIRGILNNYPTDAKLAKFFKGCVTDENGKQVVSGYDIRNHFLDEIAAGKEVLPMGKCNNFDFKVGCLGHIQGNENEETLRHYPRAIKGE